MNAKIIVFLLCLSSLWTFAQKPKVGDDVPDFKADIYTANKRTAMNLSDYKGKLLILDFWGIYCAPCIAAFPKMDSLQNKFSDKIQIILVTQDSKATVDAFFKQRKHIKRPVLPMIYGDTELSRLFPHNGVPFHVWIDGQSKVRALTTGYETREENIAKYFQGQTLELIAKKVEGQVNLRYPLFADTLKARSLMGYSYLGQQIDTLRPGEFNLKTFSKTTNRYICNGCSVFQLFLKAYDEGGKRGLVVNGPNVIFGFSDPYAYVQPSDAASKTSWRKNYSYIYDIMVPEKRVDSFYRIMQLDLLKYFDISATVQRRKLKHLVLVRKGNLDMLKSKGGEPFIGYRKEPYEQFMSIRNSPMLILADRLKSRLNNLEEPLLFADQTGYMGNVDILIAAKVLEPFDVNGLRRELSRYGLDLIEKELDTEVLVLADAKKEK